MEPFSIILPSNVHGPPDNRIGRYQTYLPHRINLKDEKWEVALTEISYSKSYYNVLPGSTVALQRSSGGLIGNPRKIEHGFYETIDQLMTHINRLLLEENTLDEPVMIFKDNFTRHAKFLIGKTKKDSIRGSNDNEHVYPLIKGDLTHLLGLTNEEDVYFPKEAKSNDIDQDDLPPVIGLRPIDLTRGVGNLYIYCDIIRQSIVGNTLTKLLKVVQVPNVVKFGDQITITPENPVYIPLEKTDFSSILIDIKDQTGETIPFQFGRTICTLHFKPRWK